MRWKKRGLIFEPPGKIGWIASHAAVPIALHLGGDRFRIYFSGRDESKRAQVGYIEIDINAPTEILAFSQQPVLSFGAPGNFDDAGAMADWIVNHEDRLYLFYTGWNRGVSVPFRNSIGVAVSGDSGRSFEKLHAGPILDRSPHDSCFVASGCVLFDRGRWKSWYISGLRWEPEGERLKHYYHIKYAESPDGINWKRNGTVAIDFKSSDEYAISRPCVVRDRDGFKMWYSFRGEAYRIGYAESHDGVKWERKDQEAGIDVSESGWDSEMVEYAYVFTHGDRTFMLYNGNGYGKTGIGLAILDKDN